MTTPRTGFSLLEVIAASAIFVTIMTLVTESLDMGTRMNERIGMQSDLNNRANSVLNKIALELREAKGDSTLVLPTGAAALANVVTYKYTVPNIFGTDAGIGTAATNFATTYETDAGKPVRQLIYNWSAGTLYRITPSIPAPGELLCDNIRNDVAPDNPTGRGFEIFQFGSTLQMNLRVQASTSRKVTGTRTGEDLVYAAQAKSLFMRSSLASSSGSAPITFVEDPDATTRYYPSGYYSYQDWGATITFGDRITQLNLPAGQNQQITIFITPPVTASPVTITPSNIQVYTWLDEMPNNWTTFGGYYSAPPTPNDVPPPVTTTFPGYYSLTREIRSLGNNTFAVTLTGNISCALVVYLGITMSNGVYASEVKVY